jgi:hypothetical protein
MTNHIADTGITYRRMTEHDLPAAIGFSFMRRFGRGHAIGPVVAPDNERAQALIAQWAEAYAGSFVRVDITGTSGLGVCMSEMGLVQVSTVVAMARNGAPPQDESVKQFAVVNQALC